MSKKIIAVLVVLSVVLSTVFVPCTLAASISLSTTVAEETFAAGTDYKKSWGTQLNSSYVSETNTGTGWGDKWLTKDASGAFTDPTATELKTYPAMNSSGNMALRTKVAVDLYRKFATPVNFNQGEGVYVLTLKNKSAISGTANTRKSFAVKFDNSVTFGYDWNSGYTKVIPYIDVNGNTVKSTNEATMSGGDGAAFDVLTATLELKKDGIDTITFKIESASDNASVTTTAEISGIAEYLVFSMNNAFVDDIKLTYDNPARAEIIAGIIDGSVSDADSIKETFEFLGAYTGSDKMSLLESVKNATAGNPARAVTLTNMSPENGTTYISKYAHEINKIDLEFNYALETGAEFGIYNKTNESSTPIATATAVLNTVSINLPQGLENGTEYVIKTADTDFKGDVVPEISFVTSPIGKLNVEDGGKFSQGAKIEWDANGGDVTASIKDAYGNVIASTENSTLESGYVLREFGNFTFDFTVSKNGYTETLSDMNFVVEQDYVPVASDVKILGKSGYNEILTAAFDYSDANNDAEGNHIIIWYKETAEGKKEIGRGNTYKIKYRDNNSNIILGVTPVSTSAINPEGVEVFSDPFVIAYEPTAVTNDSFYKLIAEEKISPDDYNNGVSGSGLNITNTYTIDELTGKPVLTGKGWLANWKAMGATDINFRDITAEDGVWYYKINATIGEVVKINNMPSNTTLYRQLATPIVYDNSSMKYVYSVDVQDGSVGAGGTRFRYKIGDSIVVGYDYTADKTEVIPVLEVNGVAIENADTLTMKNNGGDDGEFMTFTTVVELNENGKDTITLIANDQGASETAERVTVSTVADLSGKCEYVGFGSVEGSSTLLRLDNIKIEGSNPARMDEIADIIANGTEDVEAFKSALADLADYNGNDKSELIAGLKAHATEGVLEGADIIELLNISEDVEKPLLVSELNSFELEYNFKLDDETSFTVYNETLDEAVEGVVSEVDGNKVLVELSEVLENGAEYSIKAIGTDFKGDAIPDINFRTNAVPFINVSDGGHYSERSMITWTENGTEITAVLKDSDGNEETISNDFVVMNPGEYILTIDASKNGFSDTVVMNITFDEDIPPVASNVRIEGSAETDSVLEAKYDYKDANNDLEGSHNIEWYRVTADGDVKIGDGATYQLSETDENSDLYLKFIPVAQSNVNPNGEEVVSKLFCGAYKPSVNDVKITGENAADSVLETSYVYSDINNDEEADTIVKWYIKGEESDVEITDNVADGKLTITEAVFGKYVYAEVTPVSAKKPFSGDAVRTDVMLMPTKPVISNLRIEGSTGLGDVLTAYYNFTDANLDAEGQSTYEWKDSSGNVLGTDRKLAITKAMSGKTITVTVTGVSSKIPYDSESVTSESVSVPTFVTGSGGSGLSGSFGGGGSYGYSGGSSGSVKPTTPSEPEKPEEPTKPVEPETSATFKDVEKHWSKDYVNTLLEKGVVVKDENFRPDDSISRAEVLAMLFRSEGAELSKYNGTYADVNSDDWYADYIQTALDRGIISSADNFRPNDKITREETAKIITLLLKIKTEKQAEFKDMNSISDWATEYVNAVYEAGIFKGDDEGNFNGKSSLTRAETATVIYRLLNEDAFNQGGAK